MIDALRRDVQALAMYVDHAVLMLERLDQEDAADALLGDIWEDVACLRDRVAEIAYQLILLGTGLYD